MRRAALGILAVLAGIPGAVGAQPLAERDLPPVLRPWSAWIRDEIPDRVCTAVQGAAVCLWPGRLDLRLAGDGGTFTLEAYADRPLDLRLPGDTQRWPQDVRMDGRPAVVIERDEGPALRLPGGNASDRRAVRVDAPSRFDSGAAASRSRRPRRVRTTRAAATKGRGRSRVAAHGRRIGGDARRACASRPSVAWRTASRSGSRRA